MSACVIRKPRATFIVHISIHGHLCVRVHVFLRACPCVWGQRLSDSSRSDTATATAILCIPTMETPFSFMLDTAGVSDSTIKILVDQGIVTRSIFSSLQEEHFQRLMPKLTRGTTCTVAKVVGKQWLQHLAKQ